MRDRWSPQEAARVVDLGRGGARWRDVLEDFPGRSTKALAKRWFDMASDDDREQRQQKLTERGASGRAAGCWFAPTKTETVRLRGRCFTDDPRAVLDRGTRGCFAAKPPYRHDSGGWGSSPLAGLR